MEKPEKYIWKPIYTVILVVNLAFIILFYIIMNQFS